MRRGRKGAWPTDRVSEPPFSPVPPTLPILMFCFYLLHVASCPPPTFFLNGNVTSYVLLFLCPQI